MKGELIGMNTAKYVDSTVEGMGYALPISDIQDIINDILAGKSTTKSGSTYLGVTVKNITSEYAEGLNMPEGVYVYSVSEGSPAEKCGLLTGDIIVGIDGNDISDSTDLQSQIASGKVGDEIEIEFYRNENAESVIYKFLNNYETKINEKQTVDGYSKKTTVLKMVEESDTKYSLDQVMTIASIIQAEAADKEDMYYISSILHNRLTADSSLGAVSYTHLTLPTNSRV